MTDDYTKRFEKHIGEMCAFKKEHGRFPYKHENYVLYNWMRSLMIEYKEGVIGDAKYRRLKSVGFFERNIKYRTEKRLKELIVFRLENPERWPCLNSKSYKEKRLGLFCLNMRSDYKKDKLEPEIYDGLIDIGFPFNTKLYYWMNKFYALKYYIDCHKKLPDTSNELYDWCLSLHNKFDTLSEEQQAVLNSIGLNEYFEKNSWNRRFEELKTFIDLHKAMPNSLTNFGLSTWLKGQKARFKENSLSKIKQEKLTEAGVVIKILSNKEIWDKHFEELVIFRENNAGEWPRPYGKRENERGLYIWCQGQRQVKAGTLNRRNEMEPEYFKKLNEIGFCWNQNERLEIDWKLKYNALKKWLSGEGKDKKLYDKIEGKRNPLYSWLINLKRRSKVHQLSKSKEKRLNDLLVLNGYDSLAIR